jgi:hypothetical protein
MVFGCNRSAQLSPRVPAAIPGHGTDSRQAPVVEELSYLRRPESGASSLSMIGHPSGAEPLMVDVRQSGPGSAPHAVETYTVPTGLVASARYPRLLVGGTQ